MTNLTIPCFTLTVLLATGAASAAPLSRLHRHDLRFNAGFASAIGLVGMTYSYSPLSQLEIEAGSGWGYSGLQLSLMPKLSLGGEHHRFIVGAGVSSAVDPQGRGDNVHVGGWINAEVGYAYRSSAGFSVVLAAGVTHGLAGRMHAICLADCDDSRPDPGVDISGWTSPQGRVAVGHWF